MSVEITLSAAPNDAPPAPAPLQASPRPEGGDALSKLLRNPVVLAAGAALAGMALTRLMGTAPMRKLTQGLTGEAHLRVRQDQPEIPPAAGSVLEQSLNAIRPHLQEAAISLVTALLKKR